MKKSRYSESQIVKALKEVRAAAQSKTYVGIWAYQTHHLLQLEEQYGGMEASNIKSTIYDSLSSASAHSYTDVPCNFGKHFIVGHIPAKVEYNLNRICQYA